jgi:MFS family permease
MKYPWPPYLWVCFSMCVGVMGTALASPLYPLYQAQWQLPPSAITQVFVLYMAAALTSLMLLGSITTRYGFFQVLRAGVMLMTAGVLLSALAWNMQVFSASRILIGLASGMITTSASLGLTQLNTSGDTQRAAATTSLTIAFGFGLGPIVGGLVAQWAPYPLRSAYVPSLLLSALAIYSLFKVQMPAHLQPASPSTRFRLRQLMPRLTFPERAALRRYGLASMGAFCGFGMFSLFASLAPSFMQSMLPWHGPAISGPSIGLILLLSAASQFVAKGFATRKILITGYAALALCNLLLMVNVFASSALLFVLCLLSAALGHGLCNLGGISVVNRVARADHRAGLLATYLVIGYVGTILPILGVGWLSDQVGLSRALLAFCAVFALLAAALAVATWRTPASAPGSKN